MHGVNQYVYQLVHFRHRPDGYEALSYSYFLMKFALGMVDTFGVIFLFQLGETMPAGLWLVAVFYLMERLLVSAVLVPVSWVVNQFGYRRSMFAALMLLALKLYIFSLASSGTMNLVFLTIIPGALYMSLYYISFHGLFLDDGDGERLGEQAGFLEMVGRMAAVVSPLVAGILLQRLSYHWLFLIATGILILAALPLFMMPHHTHLDVGFRFGELWAELKRHRRFAKSVLTMNIAAAVQNFFWPIYVFILVGSYATVGAVFSVAMLVSSLAVYWIGKMYDRRPLHRLYPFAVVIEAVISMFRFMVASLAPLVTIDIASRMASPLWWMKIRRYELRKGEEMNSVLFGVAHELVLSYGVIMGIILSMGLMAWSGYEWEVLAVPAVFGVLLSGWLVRDR
jgi:MFS family permease